MIPKSYKALILERMRVYLKTKGFAKSGQVFKYSNGDLTYYVDLQSSKYSTEQELTFTINIGIASEILHELQYDTLGYYGKRHFSKRIGDYLIPAHDIWWTVTESTSAETVAKEIVTIINEQVLKEFEKIKTTADLIKLWMSGKGYGLSEMQRQQYLVLLYKSGQFALTSDGM